MRIGLFTDTYTPDINGVVSSIVTLQKELEKDGHEVFVITNHKASHTKREGNILRLPGLELKWLYGYKLSTPYHLVLGMKLRRCIWISYMFIQNLELVCLEELLRNT